MSLSKIPARTIPTFIFLLLATAALTGHTRVLSSAAVSEVDDDPAGTSAPKVPLELREASAAAGEEELPVASLLDQLFKQIKSQNACECWQVVNRLVRLGRAHGVLVTDRLEKELQSPDFKLRLASARALCQLNITDRAVGVLTTMVSEGETAEARRLAANAIGLTTCLYGDEATTTAL